MVKKMVSIFGGSFDVEKNEQVAYEIGKELASRNWTVVNGAGPSIMEAVSKGAKETGGTVIGIVPEGDIEKMNKYIDYPITTNMGYTRNFLVGNSSPVGIAIGGSFGTRGNIHYPKQAKDSPKNNFNILFFIYLLIIMGF